MLGLKNRLAHLTYREACKLLGPEGERLIRQGGRRDIDIGEQVTWGSNLFRVHLGEAVVAFTLGSERPKMLRFSCTKCSKSCEHLGAVFSLILEEKLTLGLSAPPPEKQPAETLSDEDLFGRVIAERAEPAPIAAWKEEKRRAIQKKRSRRKGLGALCVLARAKFSLQGAKVWGDFFDFFP